MKRLLFAALSLVPVFILIYYIQLFFLDFYQVKNTVFASDFYVFITGIALLMLSSLLATAYFSPKYTGFMFLAWSMLKIMLVMAYFVWFVLRPGLAIGNQSILYIVSLYMLYLLYEVLVGVYLLQQKTPAG